MLRLKRFTHRRASWFFEAETPQGQWVPPMLSLRIIVVIVWLPVGIALAVITHVWIWAAIPLAVMPVMLVDDVNSFDTFWMGVKTGRLEIVFEMMDAWERSEMTPAEYAMRELATSDIDVDEARKIVRRSSRHRHPKR